MKDKIVQALKAKYKTLGFSDKTFETVATHLEGGVSEESEIDTAIGGVEALLKTFQGEADNRATQALKKAKQEKPQESQQQESNLQPQQQDEMPSWAKSFMQKLEALEGKEVTKTRNQILEEKLKDIPTPLKQKVIKDAGRIPFSTNEDFEAYVNETVADVTAIAQSIVSQNISSHNPAMNGGNVTQNQVLADIDSWVASKV